MEKKVFKLVCNFASDALANVSCDDLDQEALDKFGSLMVESIDADRTTIKRNVMYMGDLVQWLRTQAE